MKKYFIIFCVIIFTHQFSFAQVYFNDEQKTEIYRNNKVKKMTILFYEKKSNNEDWEEQEEYKEIFEFNNFGYKTKDRTSQYKYLNDTILIEKTTNVGYGRMRTSVFTYNGNCRKETYTSFDKKYTDYVYKDKLNRDSCYEINGEKDIVSSTHIVYDSLGVLLKIKKNVYNSIYDKKRIFIDTIKRVDLADGSQELYKYQQNGNVTKIQENFYGYKGLLKKKWTTKLQPVSHFTEEKAYYFKYSENGLIDEIMYISVLYSPSPEYIFFRKHKFIYEFYD